MVRRMTDQDLPADAGRERLSDFIRHLLAGSSVQDASKAAGYAPTYGYVLQNRPDFLHALRHALQRRLLTEGASLGLNTLIEIAGDKEARKEVRVAAARELLRAANLDEAPGDKSLDLSVMSREQLLLLAKGAEGELVTRAKRVDSPHTPAPDDKDVDIFA